MTITIEWKELGNKSRLKNTYIDICIHTGKKNTLPLDRSTAQKQNKTTEMYTIVDTRQYGTRKYTFIEI